MQHILRVAFFKFSIYSLLSVIPSVLQLWVYLWMRLQLMTCLPTDWLHLPACYQSYKGIVFSWNSHGCVFTIQWIEPHHPAYLPSTAFQSTTSYSVDHCMEVHYHPCLITHLECISKFTWSWRSCASPHWLNHGFDVHLWTCLNQAPMGISVFTQCRLRTVSLSSVNHGLQVLHRTYSNCDFQAGC